MIRKAWLLLLVLALVVEAPAGGRKSKGMLVSMHIQADEREGTKFVTPVKLGAEARQYFFRTIPSISDSDIAWFYPFTAPDGSYGVAFKLKEHAAVNLKALTLTNQGKLLGIRCCDARLQAVLIDRPIDDGVVVLWSGLGQHHLKELEKEFPHADTMMEQSGPQFELPQR